MIIATTWKQYEPLEIKPGRPERFEFERNQYRLPCLNLVVAFWFEPKSIVHPMAHQIAYRFAFRGRRGHLIWNWIPLAEFSDSRAMPNFLIDLRTTQEWFLEFMCTEDVKDFQPKLYLIERLP